MDGKPQVTQIELAEGFNDELDTIDLAAEKKLLWKIDLHVLLPLVVLFWLSFLDRTNIGNAKIQGMLQELKMENQDYNIALMIFFIAYILFEIPSNIILRKVAPSTWLCAIIFCWGICTIGQGLVGNFRGLVAMRFLIGLFEAGFSPGAIYLLGMWYKRSEMQLRMSIFFAATLMGGAFGGLFAYAVAHIDGVGGYSAWRWIFIVEGIITAVIAIAFKFLVADWPETAKFLTDADRTLLLRRLQSDAGYARMDHLDKRAVKRILCDWKIWIGSIMMMGALNQAYSAAFFIPTFIYQLGYTTEESQVRTIPVYMVATVMSLAAAWMADRLNHRYGFLLLSVVLAAIGNVILLFQDSVSQEVQYFACFLLAESYIALPIIVGWLTNNISGHYKRAIGTAMQIGIGNFGGIIASNIFVLSQAPKFPLGFGVSLGLLLMTGIAATVFFFGSIVENRKRNAGGRDHRYREGEAQLQNMGDDHPDFRFCT